MSEFMAEPNNDEIKPCPFCGSSAEAQYASFDYNVWTVNCNNFECHANVGWGNSPDEVIPLWNRRVENKY